MVATEQVIRLLKYHNLKNTDLPPEYQDFREQLYQLTSKEQISALVKTINQKVEDELKREQSQKNNKSEQPLKKPLSLFTKLLIWGGISVGIGMIIAALIYIRKLRKNWYNKKITKG